MRAKAEEWRRKGESEMAGCGCINVVPVMYSW